MENQNIQDTMSKREKQDAERKEKIRAILKCTNEEGKTLKEVAEELGYKNSDGIGKILKRAGYIRIDGKYVLENENKDTDKDSNIDLKTIMNQMESMSKRIKELESKDNDGILVSNEEMNYKATSLRADASILADFDKVCEKYGNVTKSYLISLALKEFVEKYGNTKKD